MKGILPRYSTMKYQLQAVSGTLLGILPQMSATVPNKFRYLTYHEMSATISKCQVYIPRNVRYISI